MKITRFGQSCVLVETKGKRILVDPGYLLLDDSILKEHWVSIDAILVTHKHGDHCHADSIKEVLKGQRAKFYSSQEVADAYPELSPHVVKEGDMIEVNGIRIEVVKAVHGYIPPLKGGKEINENIGFIIDDGERRAYATSDSVCFKNDYKCDILIVPVSDYGLVMGPFEAALFAKEAGAKLVIPVHMDNPKYPVDIGKLKEEFEKQEMNLKILKLKESIEF